MRSRLRDDANQNRDKQHNVWIFIYKSLNINIIVKDCNNQNHSEAPHENLRQMHFDDVFPKVFLQEMLFCDHDDSENHSKHCD